MQMIQRKTPSQLGFDIYSAKTPLFDAQYRQSKFDDSHLSESMASVSVHDRTQAQPRSDQISSISRHRPVTSHDSVTIYRSRPSYWH